MTVKWYEKHESEREELVTITHCAPPIELITATLDMDAQVHDTRVRMEH